jgi:hypothetical protein
MRLRWIGRSAGDVMGLAAFGCVVLITRCGEWSGREPSDIDGSAREGELAGSERINAFHLGKKKAAGDGGPYRTSFADLTR